jgi:hypothetical protein
MYTAICKRNCIWNGRYWEEGEAYKGKAEPPHHFEVTERPEPGKAAPKKAEPEAGK